MHAGLFWHFHNPLNSDMNYRIFNVYVIHFECVYTWGTLVYSLTQRTYLCVNLVTSDSVHCLGTETSHRTFKQEYITGKDASPSLFQSSAQITHPLTSHYSQLKFLPPILDVSKFTWLVLDVNGMYLYKVLLVTCSCGFGSLFSFLGWLYVNGMYLCKVLFVIFFSWLVICKWNVSLQSVVCYFLFFVGYM